MIMYLLVVSLIFDLHLFIYYVEDMESNDAYKLVSRYTSIYPIDIQLFGKEVINTYYVPLSSRHYFYFLSCSCF